MLKRFIVIGLLGIVTTALYTQKQGKAYAFPELKYFPPMPVAEDNPLSVAGIELGRYLFYDSILSANRDLSCASCHKQEFAFSDAPNRVSRGDNGQTSMRNAMPLFNLAWYPAFFWDGRAAGIEDAVLHPVRSKHEMNLPWTEAEKRIQNSPFYQKLFYEAFGNNTIDSIHISKAIGQFLRTIISSETTYDRVLAGKEYFSEKAYEGFGLINDMTKGDCMHCHTTESDPLGTIRKFSNNGLDAVFDPVDYKDPGLGGVTQKAEDIGKFKIPSLRNVAVTAPYMHDGRFATLREVLDFYSEGVHVSANIDSKMGLAHRGGVKLTEEEKEQIIAFLHTLTDSVLLTNPAYANPLTKSD